MKKISVLYFYIVMHIVYIIAIALCIHLMIYRGTQVFIFLVFFIIACSINCYSIYEEITKKEDKFN
nr:MAG TPA: hypothetical protein [Crassvirales sp.]